jgi:hypothetical protein
MMDGYTFGLERNRRLIAHEEALRQAPDAAAREALEARLQTDIQSLYAALEGCGGVNHPAPKRPTPPGEPAPGRSGE